MLAGTYRHSEEMKRHLSFTKLGDKNPTKRPEVREKIKLALLGRTSPLKGRKRPDLVGKAGPKKGEYTGKNNANWRGGSTPLNKLIRESWQYKEWRKAVFIRDSYTCVFCGAKGNNTILHADHIKQFAFFPKLRLIVENGRTLCKTCHESTDTYRRTKHA